jgi:hypothetical protein
MMLDAKPIARRETRQVSGYLVLCDHAALACIGTR